MVKILTVLRLIYRDHAWSQWEQSDCPLLTQTDGDQGNIERRKTFNN